MSVERGGRTIENETLVLDLVEWIATQPRSYADVMEAWRTSCPPIWEDVVDLRDVARVKDDGPRRNDPRGLRGPRICTFSRA
jgi:hypothetical protein